MKSVLNALQGPMLLGSKGVSAVEGVLASQDAMLDRFDGAMSGSVPYSITSDGSAIIPIDGILVHKLGIDGSFFGITGYDGIERQVRAADADPAVSRIVLDIDSPGGMVAGVGEAARVIAIAEKPTVAFVNELAASAAYWLAAAADEIVAVDGAEVGSIGVIMVHQDFSQAVARAGVTFTTFKSGEFKDMGTPFRALTDTERLSFQASIDATANKFFAWVADRRGVSADEVSDLEAQVFSTDDAGFLIDRVATKDGILNSNVTHGGAEFVSNGGNPMANQEGRDDTAIQAELEQAKEQLATFEATKDQAIKDAVAAAIAERDAAEQADKDRVSAVMGLEEAKGREGVAAKLAAKGMTADDARDVLAAVPLNYTAAMDEAGGAGVEGSREEATSQEADAPKTNITVKGM